MDDEED